MSVYLDCGGPVNPPPENKDPERPKIDTSSTPSNDASSSTSSDETRWRRKADFGLHLIKAKMLVERLDRTSDIANFLEDQDSSFPTSNHSTASLDSFFCNETSGVYKDTSHEFTDCVADWGFLEFAPLPATLDPQYLDPYHNFTIMVDLTLREDCIPIENSLRYQESCAAWNSKKKTGRVGLLSAHGLGYLNATLHCLFAIGALRTAVYHIPKEVLAVPDDRACSATHALRTVFASMECAKRPRKLLDIPRAMGWQYGAHDTPFDVLDIKVCLFRTVVAEMGPAAIETTTKLARLFEGRLENTVECLNVNCRSVTNETFCDLWLNVRGCADIYESLNDYMAVEVLSGENKYRADGFEQLQEATKRTTIIKLPSILQFFLRRWRYDFSRANVMKINDRFAYDSEIDLNYLVPDSDGSDIFVLHAVIAFEDDLETSSGSYYAYVCSGLGEAPEDGDMNEDKDEDKDEAKDGAKDEAKDEAKGEDKGEDRDEQNGEDEAARAPKWLKFDGAKVTPSCQRDVTEGNFGVGGERDCNAYMLQYVRKSEISELIYADPLSPEGSIASVGSDDSSVPNQTNGQSGESNVDGGGNVEASEVSSEDSSHHEENVNDAPNDELQDSLPAGEDAESSVQSIPEESIVTSPNEEQEGDNGSGDDDDDTGNDAGGGVPMTVAVGSESGYLEDVQ
ncbi:unnamed protein product [Chondrus crispus]|uniref:USP domain-containing protein n=1 Tax=Chondrus crispus TaxID=2769 RepID=R7QI15_CHOCR|nr:unnamed protein product [Chondrus crispus]CDF37106.1 unnamed protein product [Chondrus crispus]|eukprot:XP_005716925.1 unnamed protein product [Chondrus crispus]